ncbi:MAG TPA: DsbC family protein [Dissulfurispiraceae bacterium]|nr:DsbC family protein [Dissulfurispiraceae bacterium]
MILEKSSHKRTISKVFVISMFIFIFLIVSSAGAFDQGGCNGDCNKCHSITKEEAGEIMRKLKVPDAKVLDVRMSPIKGLWEVSIDSQGKRGVFYVPFSKRYIVQGQIVEVATGADKTGEQYKKLQENRRINVSKIPLTGALILGDSKAKKRVVIFTDPECPFCARLHEEIKKVVAQRKDIAFFIKLYPLKMHPDANWKSMSIICNNSLQIMDDNFAKKPIPRTDCKSKEIDNNVKLAEKLGITGTPTIILPNGKVHSGALSADQLISLIDGKKQ